MNVSKEDLIKRRFGVEEFELEGLGTLTIRPLTRGEAVDIKGKGSEYTPAVLEQKILSKVLINPVMSEEDVKEWQDNSVASEIEPLVNHIMKISGLAKESQKNAFKSV